jgi:MYXO-CTERM domain-containing protein
MPLTTASPFLNPQALAGLFGLCALGLLTGQPAEAVSVTLDSVQAPFLCPSGTCVYDVLTTSDVPPGPAPFPAPPITYDTLSSYPLNGYSYQFVNATAASAFATAYNASNAPEVLKEANDSSLGQEPANPGQGGGPLFFTGVGTFNFGTAGTLTTANGQYFTQAGQASNNFSSNISGTGFLSPTVPQLQVWGLYKCTSGSCAPTPGKPVPAPLPLLGIGAAFGYSRRLRQRLNHQMG